jgi:hypothetical protein
VRVRPSSAACFLARFNRSSFILIVVLMHQYITLIHQYVKPSKMIGEKPPADYERQQNL